MGYSKDLGTGTVAGIDPITGYPMDRWGHLLDPASPDDGRPIEGWDKPGTELPNFTSPYGHLHFAVGTGDDFHCFDYARVNAGPRGEFIVLHSTVNSETGCFIEGAGYEVLPVNSMDEKQRAICEAFGMVDRAEEWLIWGDKPLRHSKSGWNQAPQSFAIAVARNLFPWRFEPKGKPISERAIRMAHKAALKIASECAYSIKP